MKPQTVVIVALVFNLLCSIKADTAKIEWISFVFYMAALGKSREELNSEA